MRHDLELHPVDEGVFGGRPRGCRPATKGFNVRLSRRSEVLVSDRGERQKLDVVDLDRHGAAPVHASDLDLGSRPEAVGEGDGSIRYSIAKFRAELHPAIVSAARTVCP